MTLDKGYDRFANIKSSMFEKIACGNGPLTGSYDDVIDFGWQNQATIKYLLKKSSLCIYPSRQIDADPIIIKEALSLNIPVFISQFNAHSCLINEILGEMFVINDWSIINDDYILNSLNKVTNSNFGSLISYTDMGNLSKQYVDFFTD